MKVSTVFQDSYFFDGVNLTGGTPFVEWVECLGVEETLGVASLSVGWGASVEIDEDQLVSQLCCPYLWLLVWSHFPLVATGNIDSTFIWLKESEECELSFPSKFHGCASACSLKFQPVAQNEKVETWV